jgi:MarR family transcriptional regulator, organic hydroperoxide resistance regulator
MSQGIADLVLRVFDNWKATSPVRQGKITREQYRLLRILEEEGPQMMNGLAISMACAPSTASVAVKRLERQGMVKRERGRDDERVVTVSLTTSGRGVVGSWRRGQLAELASMFDALSEQERDRMQEMLTKVLGGSKSK